MTTDVPLLIVIAVSFAFATWVLFEGQRITRAAIKSAETSHELTNQAIVIAREAVDMAERSLDRVETLLDLMGKDADDLR